MAVVKLILCIQLFVNSCKGTLVYTAEIQGIKFGDVKLEYDGSKLVDAHGKGLRHLIIDNYVNGNYVAVFGHAIYTTRDLTTFDLIVGTYASGGYVEGLGGTAKLGYIKGILNSPFSPRHLIFADHSNNCIRGVDRRRNLTYHITGQCEIGGDNDGIGSVVKVGYPVNLVQNPNNKHEIFFYDNGINSLKKLTQESSRWRVKSVVYWVKAIEGLSFDLSGEFMYFVYNTGVWRVRTDDWKTENYIFDKIDTGHIDGPIAGAKIGALYHISFLRNDLFLLVDYGNNIMRAVDLKTFTISSICIPHSSESGVVAGPIDLCKLSYPKHIFKQDNGPNSSKIYLITDKAIISLSYTYKDKRSTLQPPNPSRGGTDLSRASSEFSTEIMVSSVESALNKTDTTDSTELSGSWIQRNKLTVIYIAGGVAGAGVLIAMVIVCIKLEMVQPHEVSSTLSSTNTKTSGKGEGLHKKKKLKKRRPLSYSSSGSTRSSFTYRGAKRSFFGKKRKKSPAGSSPKPVTVYDSTITGFSGARSF